MTEPAFRSLAEVVEAELFPEVDTWLRQGRHIDDIDLDQFAFLEDAREWLEDLYDRYGCELVRASDGYYHLRPRGNQLGQRTLSAAEMLVGQALCLLRLDPANLRTAGRVERVRVLELLEHLVGADRLGKALNPRRKRRASKAVEEEEIRKAVDTAVRALAGLGFVDIVRDGLRLRPSVMRFAEPVAHTVAPEESLRELVSSGTLRPSETERQS